MKKIIITLLCLILPFIIFAQLQLKGIVLEADSQRPIESVSIYLSNTSIGTVSNAKGEFILTNFPYGKYDLVVSCLGYETHVQTVESRDLSFLKIKLKSRIKELADVVVESYDKNGWKKWGDFFVESFIGTSDNARSCKILNKEAVRFNYSKTKNQLKAFATEPLIIQNKAIGYEIKYELQTFTYNYESKMLFFAGYPFFQQMEAKSDQANERFEKKRAESYYGSMMHFMRAVYANKIKENKFEIRKIIEKSGDNFLVDSLLSADDIAYALDSTKVIFEFSNKLDITYKGGTTPIEYWNKPFVESKRGYQVSQIELTSGNYIQIVSNGRYYNPLDLLSYGYWAWSEKIANMLPFDYQPLPKANKKSR